MPTSVPPLARRGRSGSVDCMYRTVCTYVERPYTIGNMDRFSFQEAVLAEYINVLKSYSHDELLNELLDVKFYQLEQLSDEALIVELNVQRRKQEA